MKRTIRTIKPAARRRTELWQPYAWQIQSLLLGYPEDTPSRTALAERVAPVLPARVREPLLRFTARVSAVQPDDLAAAYVDTFDHRKRCCPYLTYYAHGDTRKRGLALLRLKQAYARAGWRLGDEELPDHLAVLLEFAGAEPEAGHRLLTEHRAGLELLRLSLRDTGSPWAHLLDSVSATLPPLAGDERRAVARLAAEGPPEEQVGLDPYGPGPSAPPPYLSAPQAGGPR
ncbi:nitrate reductase molybdenum cofactor assembly chaperone [Streptomyces composti]|uniref:nitrate reductase molybdenum cofactor assembly chaperone n=1 Tax=Streptomyces composti TaxID=2720025 RepID=UPI0028118122|nr:nitrate reductase molybdenum cofactor assembly chaperone [Streptomyces composti]